MNAYTQRPATQWEHADEIRRACGYADCASAEARLRSVLDARVRSVVHGEMRAAGCRFAGVRRWDAAG